MSWDFLGKGEVYKPHDINLLPNGELIIYCKYISYEPFTKNQVKIILERPFGNIVNITFKNMYCVNIEFNFTI